MDKKYQVFVSSTYNDLRDARHHVMQALLQLNCIPAGMELFPATNETQWDVIRGVIDECDYYVVIIAGRYGSIGPDKKSYTQMEYEYAVAQGKPVFGFLHAEPENLPTKHTDTGRSAKRLEAFRELIKQRHCNFWTDANDLGEKVCFALSKAIHTKPGVGWVRGDKLVSDSTAREILQLKRELEEARRASGLVEPAKNLAQGDEKTKVKVYLQLPDQRNKIYHYLALSWNELFSAVASDLFFGADDDDLKEKLDEQTEDWFNEQYTGKLKPTKVTLSTANFRKIMVQFAALG